MQSFDQWKSSDVALSALWAIYNVMLRGETFYPNDPWKDFSPQHHARKAHLHAMLSFENIESKDMANTMMPDWSHALTRLAMVAALVAPYHEPMVVDTIVDEIKGE